MTDYSLYRVESFKPDRKTDKFDYGYNEKYDFVVISKDGTAGDVWDFGGLRVLLPKEPDIVDDLGNKWIPQEYPKELEKIKTIFDWNRKDNTFKAKYIDYIEEEFNRRENGYWFINNGKPTYITGGHYMYLQWSKIDVGLPDFRESNRVFFIFWEACKADRRSFGMIYLKNRRSGFSFMSSAETSNIGTIAKDARLGILSKSGPDAKKMFTDKVVPIVNRYPFFFQPIRDGMSNPKTEIAFRVPASRITKKSMNEEHGEEIKGLDTTIDWKNTADNSYDGEKLLMLVHDESGKWEKPENIKNNWRVTKTCLRLGSKIIGKCMMGSTANALNKGGGNFKDMYYDSDMTKRSANGQTKSGLYKLFIPMEWNFEGYIDQYGYPVFEDPEEPVVGADGELITQGVITYWNNEVNSLKSDSDALNEFYRQFPRTESHAFRDESKESLFDLTKIYSQIDYNDTLLKEKLLTKGSFHWKDGKRFGEVVWTPDRHGRFIVSWLPDAKMRNNVIVKNGIKYPGNDHLGKFGCDSYDISGVVGGGGSNGALHGMTGFHMELSAPTNHFFLEYVARPQTAEMFFEDVLMAIHFYGMSILAENNKPRLLYYLKENGYRPFCMNRPDKDKSKLSKTELELGGIPNSSEEVRQAHASSIETYIHKYVGYDTEGTYRDPETIGDMYFNRTLEDWAKFEYNNRTKYDAAISSGLAIMANSKYQFKDDVKKSKISIKFARYNNSGSRSTLKYE